MSDERVPPRNFLGLPPELSDFRKAGVLVLPVPYEATVSYLGGARNGPQAIIDASRAVELCDSYEGTPFSHACVMRRIVPQADLVQVGIRAISVEEQRFLKRSRDTITTIFAEELEGGDAWMD